jgi:hypothetical protein
MSATATATQEETLRQQVEASRRKVSRCTSG